MKKLLSSALAIMLLSTSANALSIVVNGSPLSTEAKVISNKTFIPVADIAKATGSSVSWDGATKTITISKDTTEVQLKINSKTALKNGENIAVDAPPKVIKGKTYAPLSFVAKSLEIPVNYDNKTKIITIGSESAVKSPEISSELYKVTKVVDGDTIEIDYKGELKKVRMIGIDTPESVHPDESRNVPFGKVASEYTRNTLLDKEVNLEFDVSNTDKYGRLLAYVYINGEMFNKKLVAEGMAVAKTYPPDVKYADDFRALQEKARESKVGVWADIEEVFDKKPEQKQEKTVVSGFDASKEGKWIKGNTNSKKYHMPFGRHYKDVSPQNTIYFATEQDAINAGYKRSKR